MKTKIIQLLCLLLFSFFALSCDEDDDVNTTNNDTNVPTPNGLNIETIEAIDVGPMFATITYSVDNNTELGLIGSGVVWSVNENPTENDNIIDSDNQISNLNSIDMHCIEANSTIYVRAFVRTSENIFYGSQFVFETPEHNTYGGGSVYFYEQEDFEEFIRQGYSIISGNMTIGEGVLVSSIHEVTGHINIIPTRQGNTIIYDGPSCIEKFYRYKLLIDNRSTTTFDNVVISGFENVLELSSIQVEGYNLSLAYRKINKLTIDGFNSLETINTMLFYPSARFKQLDFSNGFQNLNSIGQLVIGGRQCYFGSQCSIDLQRISGLDNVVDIIELGIYGDAVRYIDGFYNLQNVGDFFFDVPRLIEFNGLQNLLEISVLDISGLGYNPGIPLVNNSENHYSGDRIIDFSIFSSVEKIGTFDSTYQVSSSKVANSTLQGFDNLEEVGYFNANLPNINSFEGLTNIVKIDSISLKSENLSSLAGLENIDNLLKLFLHVDNLSNICALETEINSLLTTHPATFIPINPCTISSDKVNISSPDLNYDNVPCYYQEIITNNNCHW